MMHIQCACGTHYELQAIWTPSHWSARHVNDKMTTGNRCLGKNCVHNYT